jgi:hypothetical protein
MAQGAGHQRRAAATQWLACIATAGLGPGHLLWSGEHGQSQYTIERPRHARELQRVDQQPGVPDLAAAVGADEAPKLLLAGPSSPGRLLLERAERSKLALSLDNLFHTGGTQAADQLVLQVGDAHMEPERFQLGATEVGAEAGPLQTAPEVALLTGVTQARQPEVQPSRTEQLQEVSDVPRTAHRHDGNALSGEIATTARGERLERDLVAAPLNQHDRPWVDAGSQRVGCRGNQPSLSPASVRLDGCQLESLLVVHLPSLVLQPCS